MFVELFSIDRTRERFGGIVPEFAKCLSFGESGEFLPCPFPSPILGVGDVVNEFDRGVGWWHEGLGEGASKDFFGGVGFPAGEKRGGGVGGDFGGGELGECADRGPFSINEDDAIDFVLLAKLNLFVSWHGDGEVGCDLVIKFAVPGNDLVFPWAFATWRDCKEDEL